MIDYPHRRRGAYALLVLLALAGVSNCCAQSDTTYNELPKRVYQPLRVTYDAFANARSTNVGFAHNTSLFVGVRSGNVSIGIGQVRQNLLSIAGPNTVFNAVTPQIRVNFGTGKFFYFGPSTTQTRVDTYTEKGYGIEVGLFMSRF